MDSRYSEERNQNNKRIERSSDRVRISQSSPELRSSTSRSKKSFIETLNDMANDIQVRLTAGADVGEKLSHKNFLQTYNFQKESISVLSETYDGLSPGYTGLINLNNTCFMSCTLQALLNTQPLIDLFANKAIMKQINSSHKNNGAICAGFSALMDSFWSCKYQAISIKHFVYRFSYLVNSMLTNGQQHDANEFQTYLIDSLCEETRLIDTDRKFEQNYDGENLRGDAKDYILRSRLYSQSVILIAGIITCDKCHAKSVKFEGVNYISLALPAPKKLDEKPEHQTALKHFIYKHFETEELEFNCQKCKKGKTAKRVNKIWQLPPILIIHMKRFSPVQGDEYIKNQMYVDFELRKLEMKDFMFDISPVQNTLYNLYAVTNHRGYLNNGHYTSHVKNHITNKWLFLDDDMVYTVSDRSLIRSKQAVTLYYKKATKSKK